MNRSLIERAMQRMADQEAARARREAAARPAAPAKDGVPTLTTLSREAVVRREADRAAAARSVIHQAARAAAAIGTPAAGVAAADPMTVALDRMAAAPVSEAAAPADDTELLPAEAAVPADEAGLLPAAAAVPVSEADLPLPPAQTAAPAAEAAVPPDRAAEPALETALPDPQAAVTAAEAPVAIPASPAEAADPAAAPEAPAGADLLPVARQPEAAPLQTPAAVAIPLAAMVQRGFLDPEDKSATVHQEFRLIKRRVLDNAFGKLRPATENAHRIMVTSALPAEGKTFCAINLAISIAIGGEHPVLLIDADIARPTIARQLDLEDHAGLADMLGDSRIDPRSLVLPTNLPGLSLLLAGAHRDQPVDLLASESMTALLDRLSALYPEHVFIIDTPPLLAVTECRTLAANAGQALLVVAAGETPRAAVQEALAQLEVCEIVGTVLNKTQARPKAPAYYGY